MIFKKFKNIFVRILVFCMLFSCISVTSISVFAEEPTPTPTDTAVPNQPPVTEDLSINAIVNTPFNGTLTATDPEGNPMVYEIVYEPQKGTVSITDTATGAFTYTPNTDVTGDDTFQFKTNDGTQDSNTATVSITISPVVSPTPTPTATPPTFVYQDLVNHWVNYSASMLADKNIIIGEKIGDKYYFYPDKVMNRAEFTLFLTAALRLNSDALGNEPVGFADEDTIPSWVLKEARTAKKQNLISGSQDNGQLYYNPYGILTRVESITILHNALNPDVSSDIPFDFADSASVPLWAVQIIKDMEGYGLVRGYDDNTIRPFQQVTRAEAAEMLYQLVKYKETHSS